MSVHVPHFPWRWPALALTALTCLIGLPTTRAALAQEPDPAPLWKAYPLKPGKSAAAPPAKRPDATRRLPETAGSRPDAGSDPPARVSVPLAAAIGFYVALAGLAAVVAAAATLHVVRRRARAVVCEISWAPDEQGDAFLATARRGDDQEWVVAQSGRFARRSPEPPEYDAASHAAYDQLLRDLYADGWLPYERGRDWWAMRLRRTANVKTPTPTRDG